MSDGEDTEEQRRLAEKKQRKADKRKRAAAEAEKDTTPTQPSSDSDAPHKRKSERRRKEEDSEAVKEEEEQASEAETKAEEASPSDGADSKPRVVVRKTTDGEEYIDLSYKRRVAVRQFRGALLVDIRETYEKFGEMQPGKTGIALNLEQWQKLKQSVQHIDDMIARCK